MAVVFPDVEKLLVAHLQTALNTHYGSGVVRVATKKAPAETNPYPSREVVIAAQYQGVRENVLQEVTAVVDVYANTYENASDLALVTGALVVTISRQYVKRAVVSVGPIRLLEDSTQEKRTLSVDITVKGSTL
jgi:hypothetical protein